MLPVALRRRRPKGDAARDARGLVESARRTDSNPQLIEAAKFIRGLIPGDHKVGNEDQARESAIQEVGLGALQAWKALSEAQKRGRGTADVAILFTDLVGFSDWALKAGDEAALELLRRVGDTEQKAISDNQGAVVKRLGDGAMAVFSRADQAVLAALAAQADLAEINVEGHRPRLRAGVHQGKPRKVGGDFLGVDVNIAARVGDAAKADQVLISDSAREALEGSAFRFGPRRELAAAGAPDDLTVCSVKSKR